MAEGLQRLTEIVRRSTPTKLKAFAATLDDEGLALLEQAVAELGNVAWRTLARPGQIAPEGEWRTWYVRGGRGSGKTWTGSNNLADLIKASPAGEWAVVAPTYGDARDVCIEGQRSGLIRALGGKVGPGGLLVDPGENIANWNRSQGILRMVNGSVVFADGADDGALRVQGKNLSGAWADELGNWKQWATAWDESLRFAVRISPAVIIATGTPKRSRPARVLIKRLLDDDTVPKSLLLTEDNAANLDPAALESLMLLAGTRLGRQELGGELLEDMDGALWTPALIEAHRVNVAPRMTRIVVAIDPAGSSNRDSDETGIIVAGRGNDGHGYVLEDLSMRASPHQWATVAIEALARHKGDRIVAEANYGGDMVEATLRAVDPMVPYKKLTASRGKAVRAEPVAASYEKGWVHHVGTFGELEDQMTMFVPGEGMDSPDRMDALVWAMTELLPHGPAHFASSSHRRVPTLIG